MAVNDSDSDRYSVGDRIVIDYGDDGYWLASVTEVTGESLSISYDTGEDEEIVLPDTEGWIFGKTPNSTRTSKEAVTKREALELTAPPSFSIIDSGMTVRAMRDSGYKSTTHALAELIDNSIESGATAIEVFGLSHRDACTGRFTLAELAVLDNGEGMDGDTLRGSLRYPDFANSSLKSGEFSRLD